MERIKREKEDLEKSLSDQLELLELLSTAFDQGKTVAAKQIATIVRILVHDTKSQHSLLSQLELKSQPFFDSCTSIGQRSTTEEYKRMGSFAGIVGMAIGPNAAYVPYLDDVPDRCFGLVPFEDFWNRIVLVDGNGSVFTRKDLILTVADQDGGAHVDPTIDKKYAALARNNSMGWKIEYGDGGEKVLSGVELSTVRQIGHEILRSLRPNIPKKKMLKQGATMIVGGMGFWVGKAIQEVKSTFAPRPIRKVGRNEKCPCGSGVEYKKCHGK